MNKRKIDLSDIKKYNVDETTDFTDLMSRSERRKQKNNVSDDIDDMINEKRKNTKELEKELKKAKEIYNRELNIENNIEESLAKTQIMDLTRQIKFNFDEIKEENKKIRKHGFSPLNIIGELNLLCMGYYIYLLAFTNYQDIETRYMINGGIIILMVLLFGLSVVTSKNISKFFNILNILIIISFIAFNIYTLIN